MTANVYIDGFNLYHGAVKNTPWKWLDVAALAHRLLPGEQINRIRYFTALVTPPPWDPGQQQRQRVYIRALETIPTLTVHYGFFLQGQKPMPVVNALPANTPGTHTTAHGIQLIEVLKVEEKGSDVNLGSYLIFDGDRGEYDTALVISNDGDLREPIRLVRDELKRSALVANPHRKTPANRELVKVASGRRRVNERAIEACQLPVQLTDGQGTFHKPAGW